MKKKLLALILVLLMLITLGSGFYLFRDRLFTRNVPFPLLNVDSNQIMKPSDWKVLHDEQHGVTLKYPPNWHARVTSSKAESVRLELSDDVASNSVVNDPSATEFSDGALLTIDISRSNLPVEEDDLRFSIEDKSSAQPGFSYNPDTEMVTTVYEDASQQRQGFRGSENNDEMLNEILSINDLNDQRFIFANLVTFRLPADEKKQEYNQIFEEVISRISFEAP